MSFSKKPGRFGATVYNTLFEQAGIDAVYLPRAAPRLASEIVDCMRSLGLSGCSVSSPHKAGVLPHLDVVDSRAAEAGAVNTIYRDSQSRLVGACTDIDGIAAVLKDPVREHDVRRAVIFGSGGVVGPAVVALRAVGVEDIAITARNAAAAQTLADQFGVRFDPACDGADLVVNATPAGAEAADVPGLTPLLDVARVFLDMSVSPKPTAIAAHALSKGIAVKDGVDLCTEQITAQAALYLGFPVNAADIRRIVLGRYLGADR